MGSCWRFDVYSLLQITSMRRLDQLLYYYFIHWLYEIWGVDKRVQAWCIRRAWMTPATITSCVFPINQCLPCNLPSVNWDWPVSGVIGQFSAAVGPRLAEIPAHASERFDWPLNGCSHSCSEVFTFLAKDWSRTFRDMNSIPIICIWHLILLSNMMNNPIVTSLKSCYTT